MGVIEFRVSDLLTQDVDAIVNAANDRLAHGGGVAYAIASVAGPELEEDSRRIGSCPTGQAVMTRAGRLPQRAVIHAVGPVWSGGHNGEAEHLASCHRAVVALAVEQGFTRVALPAISTGIFGYPLEPAAETAIGALAAAMEQAPTIELARFCFLDPHACRIYERTGARLGVV